VECVVAVLALHLVVSGAGKDHVVARPSIDHVRQRGSIEKIVVLRALDLRHGVPPLIAPKSPESDTRAI
jgi:hypothetical protein